MTTRSTSANHLEKMAQIAQIVTATAEVLGHEITPAAVEMMALDLVEYPENKIAKALQACRRELTGRLTLAAILERIAVLDGHPDPNEAWAIALTASDEARSVAMTPEIAAALTAASPVLDAGDEVGARMAFIERYKRAVMVSRSDRKAAKWYLSPGHRLQDRAAEIERMKREGLIDSPAADVLLEHHTQPALPAAPATGAVVALLTGKPISQPLTNAEQIERVSQLREHILRGREAAEQAKERASAAARDHHEQLLKQHKESLASIGCA